MRAPHVNWKWTFAILVRFSDHIFGQIVSLREKTLMNKNLVASRHIKMEKELTSDVVRRSKTSLGILSKDVFERHTSTGSEAFSLLNALTLTNLYC